ncbi:uncharacterized protein [Arachis hypogaea]|uniref:uncharacterized protein isoform X2 n=1 Tax=Arachis hypogaea TaxID=3818 RepID=UPI003B216175
MPKIGRNQSLRMWIIACFLKMVLHQSPLDTLEDIHRTLLYGGIFMYLVDKKNPDGKLRLQLQMSTCLASKESQKVEVAIGIIRRSSQ